MKIAKDNKGITLVTLAITIIIIMILTFTASYTGTQTIRNAQFLKVKAEVEIMQTYVNKWYEIYKNEEKNNVTQENSALKDYGTPITAEDYSTYQASFGKTDEYVNQSTAIANYRKFIAEYITSELDIDGIEDDFLISIQDRDVRLANGIEYQGDWYYSAKDFGIKQIESNTINSVSFNLEYGINPDNSMETDIIVSNLKFFDTKGNEIKISKFNIEYSINGSDLKKKKITALSDKYILPVDKVGTYTVTITESDGTPIKSSSEQEIEVVEVSIFNKYIEEFNS